MKHLRTTVITGLLLSGALLSASPASAQIGVTAYAAASTSLLLAGQIETGPGCTTCFDDTGWTTILGTEIRSPGGQDLFITFSMQSGLFSANISPGTSIFLESGGIRVRVLIDGNLAIPGPVTWEREIKFYAGIVPSIELKLKSGVRAFTFVGHNLPVGRSGKHRIEVQAKAQFVDVPFDSTILASAAYVLDRTLAVSLVNFDTMPQ